MNLLGTAIILWCQLNIVTLKLATVNPNKCGSKLLDDMELVPDSAFSASSSFEHSNSGDRKMDLSPKAARESYDKDNQEFAWCPKNKVSSNLQEFLEIDMGRLVVINFAQTRGRFAQGAGKEYIPYYQVQYRREATEKWRLYKKFDSTKGFNELLKGSIDPFLDAYETLDPPIVTRWIRIYPFSYTDMRVCMKLQLFGCTFESSVLEYRIPQGSEPRKTVINLPGIMPAAIKIFQDSSYDGLYDKGLLNKGLGRLTDNKTGNDFMLNPSEAQHFVGWNIDYLSASADKTLTLWFRFDSVRNFSYVRLHGYENSTMKITRPSKLEAKFSIHGKVFNNANAVVLSVPESQSYNLSSQWSQFDLRYNIGQYLQLKLHFQSDWILLTEIDFISVKVSGFQVEKEIPIQTNPPSDNTILTEPTVTPNNPQGQSTSNAAIDAVYILTILLCILVAIIVAIAAFWLIIRQRRIRRKKDIKKNELAFCSQNPFKTFSVAHNTQNMLYLGQYTSGSLRLAPRPTVDPQSDSCLYPHKMSSQSAINIPKQTQVNESNVYTSIPGSDNDSSLSTDYMASSGVNSNHPYTQTIPVSCSMSDYIVNQPQIIGNPLAEIYDSQPRFCRATKPGICSYGAEMLPISSSPLQINTMTNAQSFQSSNYYPPIDYRTGSLEPSFYPINTSYQGSQMKNHMLQ